MTTNSTGTSGAEAFRQALAPTVQAIRGLTTAINSTPERYGDLPTEDSRGMKEVAAEAEYVARADWGGPIRDTHTFGGVTLRAAADCARCFGELIGTGTTPIYGHLVLARSVLEISVVAHWLNDPGISFDARVKRGLAEQLYNAQELLRLNIETNPKHRVDYWQGIATAFGWTFAKTQKPTVAGEGRPSVPLGIDGLILKEGDWNLGRVQWSYLSSVSHGTWYGLRQAVVEPPQETALGISRAGFGTVSTSVFAQSVCVMAAVRNAATARFTLMGWMDGQWRAAGKASIAHEVELIKAFPIAGGASSREP